MLANTLRILILLIINQLSFASEPLKVELFESSTCVHCQKAVLFLDEMQQTHDWLKIEKHVINQDKAALTLFSQRLQALNENDFSVPSLFFCGIRWAGFDSPEKSGQRMMQALQFCHDNIKDGKISAATKRTLQQWSKANRLQERTDNPRNSLTQNIIVLALADVFTLCSWFALALFFALVLVCDTLKNRVKTGLILVVSIFAMHYFQQFYPGRYFQLLYLAILPGMLIALLMLYKVIRGFRYTWLDWLLMLVFTALVVAWQQSCPASLAEVNAVWMSHQTLTWFHALLYQLVFLAPLAGLFVASVLIGKTTIYTGYQSQIQQACRAVLFIIALCLLLYPSGLANNTLSYIVPVAALAGYAAGQFWRKNGHKDGL